MSGYKIQSSPPPPRRSWPRRERPHLHVPPHLIDATDNFRQACSCLSLGQIVHSPAFTLLDTMACISIGDPRMDSGIYPLPKHLIPGSDRLDTPNGVASVPFNAGAPLSIPDLLWIMDRLMACETLFHSSAPLAQTLFTCLYYHKLETLSASSQFDLQPPTNISKSHPALSSLVLRAYLICTIKCFGLARQELAKGNVFEGEDIVTDSCGLSLLEEVSVSHALQSLQDATNLLVSWTRHLTGQPRVTDSIYTVLSRLSIRKRTLLILNLFHEQLDAAVANESMPARLFRGSIDELCSDAQNHLTELVTNSSRSLVNATLRKAPSPSIAASFDPSYARRLQSAGVVPPRPVDLPTEKAIVSLWQQTFYHWKQAATLYETILGPPGSNRWELIEALIWIHGCLFELSPTTAYVRSLYQSCLCPPVRRQPELLDDFFASVARQPSGTLSQSLSHALSLVAAGNDFSSAYDIDSCARPGMYEATHETIQAWFNKGEGLLGNFLLDGLANRPRARRSFAKSFPRWRAWTEETKILGSRLEAISRLERRAAVQSGARMPLFEMLPEMLQAVVQSQSMRIALNQVMSAADLQLLSADEMAIAYWLAGRIAQDLRELQTGLTQITAPRNATVSGPHEQDWLSKCLHAWATMTALCIQSGISARKTSPWTCMQSHRKATFLRRYKWLTLPSFDAHGICQSKTRELDSLWGEYCAMKNDSLGDAVKQTAIRQLCEAQERLDDWCDESKREARWSLCRAGLQELQGRLQKSIDRSLSLLSSTISRNATDRQPSPSVMPSNVPCCPKYSFARGDSMDGCHPWFPPLIEVQCT